MQQCMEMCLHQYMWCMVSYWCSFLIPRPPKSTESVVKFQQDTETDKQYSTYNQYREELVGFSGILLL